MMDESRLLITEVKVNELGTDMDRSLERSVQLHLFQA
jgi:RNA polymerase sigma-70 factor (ECF subfamily)